MKRGEIWIGAGQGDYFGKLRPLLVVQSDRFDDLASVLTCPITSKDEGDGLMRPVVEPDATNGLALRSWIMIEKVGAVRKSGFRQHIGALRSDILDRVGVELAALLGIE